ncbi:ABC transporter ATP-binding protein [filamentous cyanobacterium CCT1]|nr:ABC transporter ATP-binding protein [filamentous cyanobacterium CCT1]PSN79754.1 ABC transporter ATP-binding protein [filamentous cyanobacterium CCP4]
MTVVVDNIQAMTAPKDSDVVLSVQGVSKKFCRDFKSALFYGMQDIGSEVLGLRGDKNDRLRKKEFWALQDVSFELHRGEALGLVGKNGSGKSTLLRIIAGLIKPDVGTVQVKGRVAPLIALGAGFNPVLTGRENIYANMSILGLTKEEIDDRFDDVVAFAEIPEAIDSPVRSYSSGMQARLGFACAIHTEPEILLVDEVLAVGDMRFRAKCNRRLHQLREKGLSFVLVSHNAQSIFNLCETSVYLSKGKLITSGDTERVVKSYEEDLYSAELVNQNGEFIVPKKPNKENLGVDISRLYFKDQNGKACDSPTTGEPATFCVEYKADLQVENAGLILVIKEVAGEGDILLILSSFNDKIPLRIQVGKHEFQVHMPYLGLTPGSYIMQVFIRKDSIYTYDYVESFIFKVTSETAMGRSLFYQPRTWK